MFPKGVSGNPAGTSKESYKLTRLARQYTEEALEIVLSVMRDPKDKQRLDAAKILLERGYGKPRQEMELSGPDGKGLFESLVSAPPKLSREEWIQTYNQALKKELTQ